MFCVDVIILRIEGCFGMIARVLYYEVVRTVAVAAAAAAAAAADSF